MMHEEYPTIPQMKNPVHGADFHKGHGKGRDIHEDPYLEYGWGWGWGVSGIREDST